MNIINFPKYRSHKDVHALKIKMIERSRSGSGTATLIFDDRKAPARKALAKRIIHLLDTGLDCVSLACRPTSPRVVPRSRRWSRIDSNARYPSRIGTRLKGLPLCGYE